MYLCFLVDQHSKTQVTKISIQRIVDHSESVGEPLCFSEDPFGYVLFHCLLISVARMIGGLVPTSLRKSFPTSRSRAPRPLPGLQASYPEAPPRPRGVVPRGPTPASRRCATRHPPPSRDSRRCAMRPYSASRRRATRPPSASRLRATRPLSTSRRRATRPPHPANLEALCPEAAHPPSLKALCPETLRASRIHPTSSPAPRSLRRSASMPPTSPPEALRILSPKSPTPFREASFQEATSWPRGVVPRVPPWPRGIIPRGPTLALRSRASRPHPGLEKSCFETPPPYPPGLEALCPELPLSRLRSLSSSPFTASRRRPLSPPNPPSLEAS
ncbi:hypothetical protein KY290_017564 [Solanum tuberosum]|uniref:Uncharacterized protein n=1 Tax=Solanum tuberosum TaxID=4113 RepID=A0ABQ7VBW7_SOLTU|nr:hypothetical protein KY290_017564 [Solanum tuberosum]